jgi:hypothetical protein
MYNEFDAKRYYFESPMQNAIILNLRVPPCGDTLHRAIIESRVPYSTTILRAHSRSFKSSPTPPNRQPHVEKSASFSLL